MIILVDDHCGRRLFLKITVVIITVDDCRSNDHHSDLCRIDANLVLIVVIDNYCSNDRCNYCRSNDCHE